MTSIIDSTTASDVLDLSPTWRSHQMSFEPQCFVSSTVPTAYDTALTMCMMQSSGDEIQTSDDDIVEPTSSDEPTTTQTPPMSPHTQEEQEVYEAAIILCMLRRSGEEFVPPRCFETQPFGSRPHNRYRAVIDLLRFDGNVPAIMPENDEYNSSDSDSETDSKGRKTGWRCTGTKGGGATGRRRSHKIGDENYVFQSVVKLTREQRAEQAAAKRKEKAEAKKKTAARVMAVAAAKKVRQPAAKRNRANREKVEPSVRAAMADISNQ